jgi:hypothetical protein
MSRRIVFQRCAWAFCLAVSLSGAACKKDAAAPAQGKRYAVEVRAGSPPSVRVTPSGGWKMNLEYEHRFEGKVAQTGAVVKVAKAQGKVSEEEVVLPVALAAGQSCEGTAYFAICTAKKCVPLEEKVTLSAK